MASNDDFGKQFEDNFNALCDLIEARLETTSKISAEEIVRSVITGSERTGAPGQPLVVGDLRGSFHYAVDAFPVFELTTNSKAAWSIETGIGRWGSLNPERGDVRHKPRSHVGGYHSIEITLQHIDPIIEFAMQQAKLKHPAR